MKKVNTSGAILKIILGTALVLIIGVVALLSREIEPNTRLVTKVLDHSKFEKAEK